jgi:hypothetical protein
MDGGHGVDNMAVGLWGGVEEMAWDVFWNVVWDGLGWGVYILGGRRHCELAVRKSCGVRTNERESNTRLLYNNIPSST